MATRTVRAQPTLAALTAEQRERLRLDEHGGLATAAKAKQFLATVGVALRYGATASLPLASMYAATARADEPAPEAQRRAAVLTNHLIAAAAAIETNAIADRLTLVHRDLAPAVLALRRRTPPDLSETATRALAFIAHAERPTAGQLRAALGAPRTWPNPVDDALGELQRATLIDRGPTPVPANGAPYLTRDGIPYRLVDETHPDLVREAAALAAPAAAAQLLATYLGAARFGTRTKLASLFGELLSRAELDAALAALAARGRLAVERVGGKELVVFAP